MSKVWVVADTHFNHHKLVRLGQRPEGFDKLLLEGLKLVDKDDTLIHLGDVEMGRSNVNLCNIGKVRILVKGNHDNRGDNYYYDMGFTAACDEMLITKYGVNILFSHEPKKVIPEGVNYNVHGHTHGKVYLREVVLPYYNDKHIEVAPELMGFKPVLLRSLVEA